MKNKILITGIILISIVAVIGILKSLSQEDDWICQNGRWIKHGNPSAPMPSAPCGTINEINNFEQCAAGGNPVMEIYPRQCKTPDGKTFTENIGNQMEKNNLIKVTSPLPNQIIQNPLLIKGEARGMWYFEASFPVKLYDGTGNLITTAIAQAQSDWMTENFVPFETKLNFDPPATESGMIIFQKDNPSGLPENDDSLQIPVKFASQETIIVKAYFNNSNMDPEFSCNKVFPVERKIIKTQAVARAAINELLKGITPEEKNNGFFTSINPDIQIQKLTIENGTAKIDFNNQIEFQVGGSCRVSAIRAQITETLKQFPTVKNVIISIDGRTEDILQP